MPTSPRIDANSQARRVARELIAGEVVGLGPGLPTVLPGETPAAMALWFLADSGACNYGPLDAQSQVPDAQALDAIRDVVDSGGDVVRLLPGGCSLSIVDMAAAICGGHVGSAVLQAAQVSSGGDFSHWTTQAVPGLFPPASAVDWASGARRVIAMMPHTAPDGSSNLVDQSSLPVDGLGCVDLIVTDAAVIRVTHGGFELLEVAPGWTADDVAAITSAPLSTASGLRVMTFGPPIGQAPNKVFADASAAVRDIPDGASINLDGFAGPGGMSHYLMVALRDQGAKDLTIISNTAGIARVAGFGSPPGKIPIDHSILVENKQVKKAIASYPVSPRASRPSAFELAFQRGEVELEVVPQGTLAERLRAGGAGIAAFYTPTALGTLLAEGKEVRVIDGKEYVLETGLKADYCLIRAHKADTLGNLIYKGTSRNFNASMAPAATVTVVEVDEIVEPGVLNPEEIVTPGIFVQRIVQRPADFSPYE